jgi:methyl-accepting chemotaxis protein
VSEITGVVADIAQSAQEQSEGMRQVNAAVGQIGQVTQQNAAMSERRQRQAPPWRRKATA